MLASFIGSRAEKSLFRSLRSESDWEDLIRTAAAEFRVPALNCRLREIPIASPPEVSDFLAIVEEMNRERNERILDEARSIASLLNQPGIEPVLLKGAAYLVGNVYPDVGCRYLCDLDVLIPASRLNEAGEVLEKGRLSARYDRCHGPIPSSLSASAEATRARGYRRAA